MRVGVISNRSSRRNRSEGLATAEPLRQHPEARYAVLDGVAGVAGAIAGFAEAGVELIVIDGGDGTVQRVLTVALDPAAYPAPPRFAILPSGTTNMTAKDVGLRGRRARALLGLLALARGDGPLHEERRPTLALAVGGRPPTLGFFFGAGALAWATDVTRRDLESRGIVGASAAAGIGITLIRCLVGSRAKPPLAGVPMRIALDGGTARENPRFLLLVTTLGRLVLGLDPFWGEGDGALRLLDIDAPPRRLAAALPALARGRPWSWMPAAGYRGARAASVDLTVQGPVLLDGEVVDAPPGVPMRLTVGREAVFVRP